MLLTFVIVVAQHSRIRGRRHGAVVDGGAVGSGGGGRDEVVLLVLCLWLSRPRGVCSVLVRSLVENFVEVS